MASVSAPSVSALFDVRVYAVAACLTHGGSFPFRSSPKAREPRGCGSCLVLAGRSLDRVSRQACLTTNPPLVVYPHGPEENTDQISSLFFFWSSCRSSLDNRVSLAKSEGKKKPQWSTRTSCAKVIQEIMQWVRISDSPRVLGMAPC